MVCLHQQDNLETSRTKPNQPDQMVRILSTGKYGRIIRYNKSSSTYNVAVDSEKTVVKDLKEYEFEV